MRRLIVALVAFLGAIHTSQAAGADKVGVVPPRIAASAFVENGGIANPQISPDGSMIMFSTFSDERKGVSLIDATTKQVIRRFDVPEKVDLEWLRWAGSNRVLFSVSFTGSIFGSDVRFSRLFVYDVRNRATTPLFRTDMGPNGDEVLFVDPAGEYLLLSVQRTIFDYPTVWRFALDGSDAKTAIQIEKEKQGVWNWFADNQGVVRMGFEITSAGKLKIWYRRNAQDPLAVIAKLTEDNFEDGIWDVIRLTSGTDQGYVLREDVEGRVSLFKFDYAKRTVAGNAFSVPGWDVTGATVDENNQLIAAFYTDDREQVVWFDPKLKALQNRFNKALPGSQVSILSRADGDKRMVVWAGREDDPGAYYIYDASKGSLDMFSAVLAGLNPEQMAVPKPIKYQARDKVTISGYLTVPRGREPKNLPLIILPHGGPFGIRDTLTWSSDVQFLANRGYAVLQPNFRGSDGYGDLFSGLGKGQIGRAMQDDLDDAMDWAVKQGIADPGRVCLVGSSYGGYAALWGVIRNPERYRCAASFAGVTDWKAELKYDSNFFNRKNAKRWRARIQGDDAKFDLDLVSPAKQAARLTRPVLLAHGQQDWNVPFTQFKAMRDAAAKSRNPVQPLVFEKEGHGFAKAENEVRWLETLDAFLAKHNPAD